MHNLLPSYCKLQILFFSSLIYGSSAKHEGHELKWKKLVTVTYSMEGANNVSLDH